MKVIKEPESFYNTEPVQVACANKRCNAVLEVHPGDVTLLKYDSYLSAICFNCPCCGMAVDDNSDNKTWKKWDKSLLAPYVSKKSEPAAPKPEPSSWLSRIFR